MAALRLFLLFSLSLLVSTSARSTPPTTTESSLSSSSSPPPNPSHGPIKESNGKYYNYVCDPNRFQELGLDIQEFAYCNKDLPFPDRVKDLISRMTLDEKILQLGNKARGAKRVGLPPYEWWSEALHGVSDQGRAVDFTGEIKAATSFPTVITSAASFNESLWQAIGQVISKEARAMYNYGQAGLTFWSPNINVVRDPRWGRILETPGEDPYVVGRYAVDFVSSMENVEGAPPAQDPNSRPLKVSTCCKHFAAYDVDNWFGVVREEYDARVTEQDMVETFMRPFEMCVKDGDVSSVMCSYNRINGIPACADSRMHQTVREEWNLHGYTVSDCDSIEVMVDRHHWLHDTGVDAVSQTLKAGLDLDCGDFYTDYTGPAVAQGKVREDDIDNALKNLYTVLFRLGYFDRNPQYESLGKDDVCTKESVDLAAEAAKEGVVLLKNNDQTLPLDKQKYPKIALVGPHANATAVMIGNYAGKPCGFVTPYDAFSQEADVDFVQGVSVWCLSKDYRSDAMKAAANADATIIVGGLEQGVEWESLDRSDLKMPGYQEEYINDVANASAGPVVLVLMSAGGIDITFAKNNPKIGAILWTGYPGAVGGRAIADIVYGRYNPGGRLPITWYQADYADSLPMTSMQLRPDDEMGYPGRTYKFFNGSVVYPFAYGLSYTQFKYTIKSTPKPVTVPLGPHQSCRPVAYAAGAVAPSCAATDVAETACEGEISFEVQVANTGKVDGSEVVLVYSKAPANVIEAPIKQLVAFKRVFVAAGKSEKVKFTLNVCKSFSLVDKSAYVVLPSGEHTVVVGNDDEAVKFPVKVSFQ